MSDFEENQTETQKEETKETNENGETEEKKDDTEKKEEEVTEEKPKRRRSTKFQPASLNDPEKGIRALHERLQKFDPEKYPSKNEAFHAMMRIYQRWAYRLYPGEFSDTCWKIANTSGTKTIVRNYIYEMNGGEPLIYDESHPDGVNYFQKRDDEQQQQESDADYKPEANEETAEQPTEEPQKESTAQKVDFFSSDDDEENESQTIPEILDLFASQRQ